MNITTVDTTTLGTLAILPTIRVTQGLPRFIQYTFEDIDGAIDLSAWTGEFTISRQPFDDPILRVPLALNASGEIRVNLTAEQTADLAARAIIGGATNAMFQIRLTAPDPEFNQVWQGDVAVAGTTQ